MVLSGAFPTARERSASKVGSADKVDVLLKWWLVAPSLHRLFLSAHRLLERLLLSVDTRVSDRAEASTMAFSLLRY